MDERRIVVVGAGPAGAALAYLLARRGIAVTLLERHTDFAREFRGEALMPSGVRAESTAGSHEVRGDLVVGADGRASVLRVRAGLHEERTPQHFDVVWCKVPLPAFAREGTARAYLGRGHAALAFPAYDGRLQV